MHYHRIHSDRIKVPHEKRRKSAVPGTNGHRPEVDLGKDRQSASPPAQMPVKRKYHKRQKLAKTRTVEIEFDFCPHCLTNLHRLAMGMILAGVKKKVNGCPKCGLDLRAVAAGMVLSHPPEE